MNLQEYVQYDGMGLAELVRKKELSAQELATLALEAVAKVNPQINAVIEVYVDRVETAGTGVDREALFAGVPFFFKSWGEWSAKADHILTKSPGENTFARMDYPDSKPVWLARVGKKKAGRELDGKLYEEMPRYNG